MKVILVSIISVLLLGGCVQPLNQPMTTLPPSLSPDLPTSPTPTTISERPQKAGVIGISDYVVWVGTDRGFYIGGGYYPGGRAEHVIPIFNNSDEDVQVQLSFGQPPEPYLPEYIIAPEYVKDWVTFEDDVPVIPAHSMRDVLVILEMPETAKIFAPKWEFWVVMVPMGQGTVESAVAQTWMIQMKDKRGL